MKRKLKSVINATTIFIVVIALVFIWCVWAICSAAPYEEKKEDNEDMINFEIEKDIWIDNETGVQYIVVQGRYGPIAITPRLASDGSVMIVKENDNE